MRGWTCANAACSRRARKSLRALPPGIWVRCRSGDAGADGTRAPAEEASGPGAAAASEPEGGGGEVSGGAQAKVVGWRSLPAPARAVRLGVPAGGQPQQAFE